MRNSDIVRGYVLHLTSGGRSRGTISLRRSHVVRVLEYVGCPVGEITTSGLESWLSSGDWGPAARASARASLRSFFEWATREGHCAHNPAAGLLPVARPRAVPRPIPDALVMDSLRGAASDIQLAIEVMACCGLRRAEVSRLRGIDAVPVGQGWVIRVTGKGGHMRSVPAPPGLARRIAAHSGYVFPGSDNGHVSPGWLGKRINRALPPGWTAHKLRHRFATVAYSAERDLRAVQELLGHASPATTQVYAAVAADHLNQAAAAAWRIAC